MAYRLAVFDMAGTTVSASDLVVDALIDSLARRGFVAERAAVRPLMGYPKPQAIRMLLGADNAASRDARLVDALHRAFVADMIEKYRTSVQVTPMPGAQECFAALRARGVLVALNTAFSRDIAQTIVDRFGWLRDGTIDDLIATDEVAAGRPHPDMIRALMARHGVTDAGAVVKTGDTEVDVQEGRNARAGLVVAVTTGAFRRAALEACAPDYVIDNLTELPPLLEVGAPSSGR